MELGRGFEVRPSIGRRSSGDRSDRIKLRSLIVLHPPGPGRARYEEEQRSPGTHTEVRPGDVVVVVDCVQDVVERPEPAYTRSHVAKLRQGG